MKKVVITGASGFIGRQLVPRLHSAGCEMLLVGRDPIALKAQFPHAETCSYANLQNQAMNADILVHLAVLNNTSTASKSEFEQVNVDLFADVLAAGKLAMVKDFINVTTFHTESNHHSDYAESKRKALELAKAATGLQITNLFLPAVYGDTFAGRLRVVTKFPRFLQPMMLACLTALSPTVHVDRIAQFLNDFKRGPDRDVYISNPQDRNIVFAIFKKLLDLLFVIGVVGVFWWLLLIVSAMIFLDSRGPIIFAQVRIGKNGKPFTVYKFRTMETGTRQAGTHEVTAASVTRMGSFLRKAKIDELPQVLNIVRGEMSLIGPRPCLPMQTELIEERQRRNVLAVTPGITGLAQINNIDMSDPVKLAQWDAKYIAQRSILSEAKILIMTFIGKGSSDKVAR